MAPASPDSKHSPYRRDALQVLSGRTRVALSEVCLRTKSTLTQVLKYPSQRFRLPKRTTKRDYALTRGYCTAIDHLAEPWGSGNATGGQPARVSYAYNSLQQLTGVISPLDGSERASIAVRFDQLGRTPAERGHFPGAGNRDSGEAHDRGRVGALPRQPVLGQQAVGDSSEYAAAKDAGIRSWRRTRPLRRKPVARAASSRKRKTAPRRGIRWPDPSASRIAPSIF